MPPQPALHLPWGFRDAKTWLLVQAIIGEFFQGGLIFGWNALALTLKAQGNYNSGCGNAVPEAGEAALGSRCSWQESRLAVLWNIGVFALNFGPVFVGPVLDWVGPKLTAILGTLLNMLALALLGCSSTRDFNGLPYGAVLLGLAGITFHLSQLHVSNLFPRSRGLISSLLVAGFTGCGILFYFLDLMFVAAGSTRVAYRLIMLLYAAFIGLWVPLNLWMMPWHTLRVGQVYLYTGRGGFKVMERKEVERQAQALRETALEGPADQSLASALGLHGLDGAPAANGAPAEGGAVDRDIALAYMGLRPSGGTGGPQGEGLGSDDPSWMHSDEARNGGAGARGAPEQGRGGARAGPDQAPGPDSPPAVPVLAEGVESPVASPRDGAAGTMPLVGGGSGGGAHGEIRAAPLGGKAQAGGAGAGARPDDVEWGALVFESRRFVELRKQTFWTQFLSNESFGMGVFYTLNVFCIQFYLGTTRLQLEHKGDSPGYTYTGIANVVPAFGFLGIPIISWLLDKQGYGITLGTINCLGVMAAMFQAMPSLGFQIVTLVVWCAGRFFLYTSYYSIFGALFGFTNFGRMMAIDNAVNGLFGLMQLPLTNWGIHGLGGNFTAINLLQVVVLLPLFTFCYCMYVWERSELVPIRPAEGEELPVNMLGARPLREAKFLETLERRLSGAASASVSKAPY